MAELQKLKSTSYIVIRCLQLQWRLIPLLEGRADTRGKIRPGKQISHCKTCSPLPHVKGFAEGAIAPRQAPY
jgi:hypothetical protein